VRVAGVVGARRHGSVRVVLSACSCAASGSGGELAGTGSGPVPEEAIVRGASPTLALERCTVDATRTASKATPPTSAGPPDVCRAPALPPRAKQPPDRSAGLSPITAAGGGRPAMWRQDELALKRRRRGSLRAPLPSAPRCGVCRFLGPRQSVASVGRLGRTKCARLPPPDPCSKHRRPSGRPECLPPSENAIPACEARLAGSPPRTKRGDPQLEERPLITSRTSARSANTPGPALQRATCRTRPCPARPTRVRRPALPRGRLPPHSAGRPPTARGPAAAAGGS
jgi:hypothetical protein